MDRLEELQKELDFYGTAMQVNPMAIMDVIRVDQEIKNEIQNMNNNSFYSNNNYDDSDDFSLKLTK